MDDLSALMVTCGILLQTSKVPRRSAATQDVRLDITGIKKESAAAISSLIGYGEDKLRERKAAIEDTVMMVEDMLYTCPGTTNAIETVRAVPTLYATHP